MEDRHPSTRPQPDHCRATVRRWPELRGEAKLCWEFLWDFSGRKPGRVIIHIGIVADDQGITEKNARRHVKTLASHGLVQLLDTDGPRWTMYLEDPLEISKGRVVRADPQGELFDDEEPAEEAPRAPERSETIQFSRGETDRSVPTSGQEKEADCAKIPRSVPTSAQPCPEVGTLLSLPIKDKDKEEYLSKTKHKDNVVTDRSGNTSVHPRFEQPREVDLSSKRVYDKLLDHYQRIAAEQPVRAEAIAQQIFRDVGDPGLPMAKCRQIAHEIVTGCYPQSKLASVLANLETEQAKWTAAGRPAEWKNGRPWVRGAYFQGAMRRSFVESGLSYVERRREE